MSPSGPSATPLNVSKYLATCGFKRSRMDSRTITDGSRTGAHPIKTVGCTVTWTESLASSIERREELGLESFGDLPEHPDELPMLEAYWEALRNRYDVGRGFIGRTIFVGALEEEKAAVPGRPTRAQVAQILEAAGAVLMSGVAPESNRQGVAATQEYDHVRLLVRPWKGTAPWYEEELKKALQTVKDSLIDSGLHPIHFTSRDCPEGFVIRVYSEETY